MPTSAPAVPLLGFYLSFSGESSTPINNLLRAVPVGRGGLDDGAGHFSDLPGTQGDGLRPGR